MPEAPNLQSPITLLECSRPLFSLHNCFNFFEEKKKCKLLSDFIASYYYGSMVLMFYWIIAMIAIGNVKVLT